MKRYIAIDLVEMRRNKLTIQEWTLLTCIVYSSNNEFNSCFMSRQKLADHLGVSKRQMYLIIAKLIEEKWLQKLSNSYLKVTKKWLDLDSEPMVQNLHSDGAEFAPSTIKYEYKRGAPTEEQVKDIGNKLNISEETCMKFYLYYESKGWKGILDFVPLLRKWNMSEKDDKNDGEVFDYDRYNK